MKKILIASLFLGLLLTSCKKETKEESFYENYSELSVEDNKASLEQTGLDMMEHMDELKNSQAIDVAANFANYPAVIEINGEPTFATLSMELLASMKTGLDPEATAQSLKAAYEDPATLSEAWDELVGTYDYNFFYDDWDFTPGGNAIIFNFPGLETDQTNTAEFKVYNFTYVTISSPDFELPTEMPTSLDASLKYNGSLLSSYTFDAVFQNNGLPTSIETALTVGNFEFSVSIAHSQNTSLAETTSLKYNNEILVEFHAGVSGNWSEENIENNTIEIEDEYYYYTEVYIENIIQNANAHIQLMNIKVVGIINYQKLGAEMRKLDEQYADDYYAYETKEYNEKVAALLNANAKLAVIYADTDKKIAGAEAYVAEDMEYGGYYTDLRFVFADGSKASAEQYFSDGFEDVIDQLNDLITEINEEYDLFIEPIVTE